MVPSQPTYFLLCLLLSGGLTGQTGPRETLQRLFTGMREADTTGMASLFHPGASLHSVSAATDGTTKVTTGSLPDWLEGISRAKRGAYDEQLHYTSVRTDGGLATAWTPYTFVLEGEAHHCGTNAFHFVQDGPAGAWRIINIVDTRSSQDCAPVDTVPAIRRIEELADAWHLAAARADSAAYFDRMAEDAVYIGTDPEEHWTKGEFLAFAAPYFRAGKAWDFTARERHVFYEEDQNIAYWDELLDTWMGACRGTAVVERIGNDEWIIKHYTLSLAVPNPSMESVITTIRDGE